MMTEEAARNYVDLMILLELELELERKLDKLMQNPERPTVTMTGVTMFRDGSLAKLKAVELDTKYPTHHNLGQHSTKKAKLEASRHIIQELSKPVEGDEEGHVRDSKSYSKDEYSEDDCV